MISDKEMRKRIEDMSPQELLKASETFEALFDLVHQHDDNSIANTKEFSMQGNNNIDTLMMPVLDAIKRYVKDKNAITDIYNRAYEAVINSMDVKEDTHYNDAVSAGKVSVDVKRELSDAEINELGAQEAEKRGEK